MSHPSEQIRFCTSSDGVRIAYTTCGTGAPLVWVAPFSHSLRLDWQNPIWRPWLELLTRRHSVTRYDWRGCGLSDRDGVEFSFEKHIQDLEAIVKAVGLQRFVLVGHEGGGTMCIPYAVRHPEQVTHLILNGCAMRGGLARAASAKQVKDMDARRRMVSLGWDNDTTAFSHFHAALHMPDGSREQQLAFNDSLHQTTLPANAAGIIDTFSRSDVQELVPKIVCPLLVLHARGDSIVPFEEGRTIAAMVPGSRLTPLESRNHDLLNTEPAWQQMVEALDDFLPASSPVPTELFDVLSSREREVLEFVAQGLDNKRISARLNISEKTIRNHVSAIFSKLEVNNRAQAVALARDVGFGRRMVP